MLIKGIIWAESPIFRGNAKKTLFTRDEDGTHRLVSLAGNIEGTAQSLMDAFLGRSRNGQNIGLLNRMWIRLYGKPIPEGLITNVTCKLQPQSYTSSHFFDLRMGLRLNEDRWANEPNANYKMETVIRRSAFDFVMSINDRMLSDSQNATCLYYVLQEMIAGRFWFGAAKSRGLGRLRLEADIPIPRPESVPALGGKGNHLTIGLHFVAENPILVGWNWGKTDTTVSDLRAAEGRMLIQSLAWIPQSIRTRLEATLAGPVVDIQAWKNRLVQLLPRVAGVWLLEAPVGQKEEWFLADSGFKKLSKGKNALAAKILDAIRPLIGQPFASREEALESITKALQKKANMAKRVMEVLECRKTENRQIDPRKWDTLKQAFRLPESAREEIFGASTTEAELSPVLAKWLQAPTKDILAQVDHHFRMLQSDPWVDSEIAVRQEHLQIKRQLLKGEITEAQWNDAQAPPNGISAMGWRAFLSAHERVAYRHMLNTSNLKKSITNDENMIAFFQWYRERVRQELVQPQHIDFRLGAEHSREISRAYGKPYDSIFLRMLSWTPSQQKEGAWEIYVPGSTIKGAFRRRASQILKTLHGETAQVDDLLIRLFGAQNRPSIVLFSDAYLADPENVERSFCSMDGVRMDPISGKPVESAKRDYLFAYGKQLQFSFRLDVRDIDAQDLPAINLLLHLIQDFQRGDIPFGGEKTNGMGWVCGKVNGIDWRARNDDAMTMAYFEPERMRQNGIWREIVLDGMAAVTVLNRLSPLKQAGSGADDRRQSSSSKEIPLARAGFVSHRSFGGLCGEMLVEASVLSPLHIRKSGEPSHTKMFPEGPVYGFDFFQLAPPEKTQQSESIVYALPSTSIKGIIRNLYSIVSNTTGNSTDLSRLTPADALFGWVGEGPEQALMGRVVFDFAHFDRPQLGWFKAPYPYGQWRYYRDSWVEDSSSRAEMLMIDKRWRLFPHVPLAPIVTPLEAFQPDTAQALFFNAVLPGSKARFRVRFWNLRPEELQRLIWCIQLEPEMAHKMGHLRYLGLGSVRFQILPESFLIDWEKRYADPASQDWQTVLDPRQWLYKKGLCHYPALKQALNAQHI